MSEDTAPPQIQITAYRSPGSIEALYPNLAYDDRVTVVLVVNDYLDSDVYWADVTDYLHRTHKQPDAPVWVHVIRGHVSESVYLPAWKSKAKQSKTDLVSYAVPALRRLANSVWGAKSSKPPTKRKKQA